MESLGRLFVPAWIIACDGSVSRLIESISFEISSADFSRKMFMYILP